MNEMTCADMVTTISEHCEGEVTVFLCADGWCNTPNGIMLVDNLTVPECLPLLRTIKLSDVEWTILSNLQNGNDLIMGFLFK